MDTLDERAKNEIEHSRRLAEGDAEATWGWGTPAGKLRLQRRSQLIAEGAQLRPGMRVLEIGCGTGALTEQVVGFGASIVAVDISEALIHQAVRRGLPSHLVKFECGQFEHREPEEGGFDAVIGSSILHHLEVDGCLAKIRELLKPQGRMSFAEPNLLNPQVLMERKLRFIRPLFGYVSPDETAFVRWRFRAKLMQLGFERVEIRPFDWLHPATPVRFIRVVQRIGKAFESAALVREFAGSLHIQASRPAAEEVKKAS